ncbi:MULTISPECIES: tetratricopeptide repeat protein [unclassified Mameliella]|uniref:tetratricopeptide repeat protein n=1 Tax=unclassified Mameliella TaxID=2630630 RepID=UPI00273D1C52|nr:MULTISPECIES: tetratricopeptide repeat protein [unclassified Mameliella]
MSDADSFIDEVTEEVKRDRLYATLRKWGWVGVVIVLLIVGGTAWREWRIASAESQAQAFGDSVLDALDAEEPAQRIDSLTAIEPPTTGGAAILSMLTAAEEGTAGDDADAVARLQAVAANTEIPAIYRQIASYKALTRGASVLPVEERRAGFEALAVPGQPLRLLAEEQLALIEIETGDRDAAIARLERLAEDAEATQGLQRRAGQLIVALGGDAPGN